VVLDMDSSESPTHGEQEGSAWNGHFGCTCYHPLFLFMRERLIKIGARVVSHGRYVTFQMAEVAVPRRLFAEVLWLIGRLRAPPAPA
jgi:hypothetical protein